MGLCRVLVYVGGVFAVREAVAPEVAWGAAALLCHLVGLSYAAKQVAFNRLTRVCPLAFLAADTFASQGKTHQERALNACQ